MAKDTKPKKAVAKTVTKAVKAPAPETKPKRKYTRKAPKAITPLVVEKRPFTPDERSAINSEIREARKKGKTEFERDNISRAIWAKYRRELGVK